jgi:glycosyltransferase involved in cell wall biosynthesis
MEALTARAPAPAPAAPPQLEIVVPVYNEEHVLEDSIRRLHDFLTSPRFPFTWRIAIADNASTDGTLAIARRLQHELPNVHAIHLDAKGRGRALRTAWSQTDAEVACYMDVDLSTDLRALLPLVAPLLSGHSELAIGTRLAPGARVTRGPKREFISRTYNRILKTALRARFSDAQCGFKAARTGALKDLLPDVRDQAWFFDTELLIQAQRRGMRVHEVPVDWVDDPDSRVAIVSTAVEDLKGVARLLAASRVARFMAVGVASTLAYALLFLALSSPIGAGLANATALAITAVANTAANRRWTFGVRGHTDLIRHHAQGAFVYLLTLGLTSAALAALIAAVPDPSRALQALVLTTASVCATVTRYIGLTQWVFAGREWRARARMTQVGSTEAIAERSVWPTVSSHSSRPRSSARRETSSRSA